MAVGREYNVIYRITADTSNATNVLTKFQRNVATLKADFETMSTAFTAMTRSMSSVNNLTPKLNISEFKHQLNIMKEAVAITARSMRATLQTALTGYGEKGLDKAISNMRRDSVLLAQLKAETAKLEGLKNQLRAREKKVVSAKSASDQKAWEDMVKSTNAAITGQQNVVAAIKKQIGQSEKAIVEDAKNAQKAIASLAVQPDQLNKMATSLTNFRESLKGISKYNNKDYKVKVTATVSGLAQVQELAAAIASIKSKTVNVGASTGGSGAAKQARPKGIMTKEQLANLKGAVSYVNERLSTGTYKLPGTMAIEEVYPTVLGTQLRKTKTGGFRKDDYAKFAKTLENRYLEEQAKYDRWTNRTTAMPTATATPIASKKPYLRPTASGVNYNNFLNPPLSLDRTKVGGQLRSSLVNLQSIINQRGGLRIPLHIDRTKVGGELRSSLVNLQTLLKGRTIRVNLDISGAKAQLESLIAQIKAASPQNIRVGIGNSNNGKIPPSSRGGGSGGSSGGGSSNQYVNVGRGGSSVQTSTPYSRSGNMTGAARWYPLFGNTSLGARTPMIVDMAKGMGVMMAVGGAMGAVSNSIHQSFEYENLMETAKAILRNNGGNSSSTFNSDFDNMAKTVRRVGVKTKFTAPEVAGAAKYLAMAGLDINTINSAIEPVANVALAGDLDLATTADKLTNIMTSFEMKPQQIGHLSDMLVNTFTKTNTSMMQLAEASQYAAPLANTYGMDITEMLAIMGIMGNAGIQGSLAGTSLRMIMQNLVKPSKRQAALWEGLNIARENPDGTPRRVTEILQEVANKVPQEKLIKPVMEAFRVTSAAGAAQVIKHLQQVDDLATSNANVNGLAHTVGLAKQNTVQGLWAQVQSTFTEGILQGVEKNQGKIKDALKEFRDFFASPDTVRMLGKTVDLFMELAKVIGEFAKIYLKMYDFFGPMMMFMWKMQLFLTMIGTMLTPFRQLYNFFGTTLGLKGLFGRGAAAGVGAAATGGIASTLGMAATGGMMAMGSRVPLSTGAAYTTAPLLRVGSPAFSRTMTGTDWVGNAMLASMVIGGGRGRKGAAPGAILYQPSSRLRDTFSAGYRRGSRISPNYLNWRHADEYRRRAEMYERAHAKYQEIYNKRWGSVTMSNFGAREMAEMERMRERSGQLATNAQTYRNAAESTAMRRAMIEARANNIYGAGARFSRGFSKAVNFGANTYFTAALLGGAGKLATAAIPKLGMAIGALLNPFTILAAGATALGVAIWNANKKIEQANENMSKSIAASNTEERRKLNAQMSGHFADRPAITLEDFSGYRPTWNPRVTSPQLRHLRGSTDIFQDLKHVNSKNYANAMYLGHIKPFLEMYGLDMSLKDVEKKFGIRGSTMSGVGKYDERYNKGFYSVAMRAAIGQYAIQMPEVQDALAKIKGIREKYTVNGVRDEAKIAKETAPILNQYAGYNNYESILHNPNLANMRGYDMLNSKEGRQDVFQLLTNAVNFNEVSEQHAGWLAQLEVLIKNTPILARDINGQMQQFYFNVTSAGFIDFEATFANLQRLGINIRDSIYNRGVWASNFVMQFIDTTKSIQEQITEYTAKMQQVLQLDSVNSWMGLFNWNKTNKGAKTWEEAQNTARTYFREREGVKDDKELQNRLQNMTLDEAKKAAVYGISKAGETQGVITPFTKGYGGNKPTFASPSPSSYSGVGGGTGGTGSGRRGGSKDQSAYGNHYSRQAARPTQIVVNINSLANFDKTYIAKGAEEREMTMALEEKIGMAIQNLTAQLAGQLSIVGENAGSYSA